jgi:hypothetical protein
VTEYLVPQVVREAGSPWSSTKVFADGGGLSSDAPALVTLLDRVLAALEEVPQADEREIPEGFLDSWSFTAEWLSETMPSLSTITREALEGRLREQIDDPPPGLVEAIGQYWVRWLLEWLLWRVLSALDNQVRQHELDRHATRLLEVAERRVPAAQPVVGKEILRTVAAVIGKAAIPLLERLASTASLRPEVREQAKQERRLLAGA